ncbi:MAG TPA: protein kinase [Candidatus Acidoferrales bacterium]|nr:protein kinase [Candidatus Acidoferrales bacterium]
MPLAVGTSLGSYQILASIGAGGMGEVYRARDSKLGRDVALKVLPQAFARDADRMARFQREAKVLASLNHPNIATIHGLEDSGSTHALVMELVEGPTLADRIRAGPIPIDEAIRIARQIADALEYAHERGIVHRDLKPANVKVTADDAVKVLDFGLAKALEGDAASYDISTSPTLSRLATMQGVLLGTAAYMSPEQAKGKQVDRRADIWAFGCVLYEMLTGRQTFTGETVTDTLAAVIKEEPDWSRLPAATPMRVRVLLQRCLQKDPKQRLRDIGDARISIDEVLTGAPEAGVAAANASPAKTRWLSLAIGVAGLALGATIAGVTAWNLKPVPARLVTRTSIVLPPGQHLTGLDQSALAISRDGTRIVYVAAGQGNSAQQIYVRSLDSLEAKAVPGTEGATGPVFSPDGQWLAFFADSKLKKIPLAGGAAQTLQDIGLPRGASWGSEGFIAFAPVLSVVSKVPETGGSSEAITRFEPGEATHLWPQFLPGSKEILFAVLFPNPGIAVQSLPGGQRRMLIQTQATTAPRYTSSGHLVYAQGGNLMAVPFDLEHLSVSGNTVPVLQGVLQTNSLGGPGQYDISENGSLVYVPGGLRGTKMQLVWVTRDGAEKTFPLEPGDYDQPRVSPDGRRIALDVGSQVRIYDTTREALTRLTFEGTTNQYPVWTPDGKRVAFMSDKNQTLTVFWQPADGSGRAEELMSAGTSVPFSWSPDGKQLAYITVQAPNPPDISVLNLGDGKSVHFLQESSSHVFQDAPQFSPDGRWIAYASDETGRREVYVQPYPGPGGKWQISTDGGSEPQWNRNGRELFYRTADKLMAVDVSTKAGFESGKPRELFEDLYLRNGAGYSRANYDISPDGQRFLMLKPVTPEQAAPTQINVVLNWTEELKRLVPTGK